MDMIQKKLTLASALLLTLPFVYNPIAYAAQSINLRHQTISTLKPFMTIATKATSMTAIKEISRHVDFNHTLHIRIQETYLNYPIWGADAVIHVANGNTSQSLHDIVISEKNKASMNGIIYQELNKDLEKIPNIVFTESQAEKALKYSIDTYQRESGNNSPVTEQVKDLIVYIGEDNKAHWAYKVSFRSEPNKENAKPVRLVSILDAITFKVYVSWDDIKNLKSIEADGGGFGGNIKMGKLVYDGLQKNLAKLNMMRDDKTNICYLQNSDVTVKDNNGNKVMTFNCEKVDDTHKVYWDADFDAVNNGYSPGNDALFGGQVIKHMYQDWYGVPVLVNADGSPMMLTMVVHLRNYDNAYWDGTKMSFGDGYTMFYPLTSLGVASHEISHGFTQQHSNLHYYRQSGGMNEAFSDMAAQAAEVYAYGIGKNSWQIGPEIFKAKNRALRYMDLPSKDCTPGAWQCSIDDATQYTDYLDVHYSSGVYNRLFYQLGTAKGWDARKAFDVMVHANTSYWTSSSTFKEGACGIINAAKDLKYDLTAVKAALNVVKIDYSQC